jgi:plasmid maintenance system antidote protein VapI
MFKNLEAEMSRYDVTVKDLALCIGVYEKTMRNYLSRTSKIAWEDARKIKHTFFPQFEMEYLFYYEEKAS